MKYYKAYYSFLCFFIPIYAEFSLEYIADTMQLPVATVQKIVKDIIDRQARQENGKGWSKYYHLLPNIINQHEYKIGCEVGVAYGGHSVTILNKTNVQKLFSIDPYLEYGDTTNSFLFRSIPEQAIRQRYWDVLYFHVCDRLSIFDDRSELWRMTSVDASKRVEDESFDFVFLDANHTFESVMQDLHAWFDKIRSGGIFCGDDYESSRHSGVTRAVNHFFKIKDIPVHTNKSHKRFWWVYKP